MKSIFFLDIDTRQDLMFQNGALYVPGAERLPPKFRRLFDCARKHEILVLSPVDANDPDDLEFKEWPRHGLRKSEGQGKGLPRQTDSWRTRD